ncbi:MULTISPECIES: hypothetical protein [Rhizobium/Agrobacterium group]|uniref:Uncharacterized protein n=2 Tax=Neorhizobium TaxID=1525371 RepID=A0ABV0M4S6_9HYPH|nr:MULTISPECIES: hypothetical protein [Rhizobium/Agrobacterium group]MCC2612043.1 hypothetical protein [Neorhizobium petrolearium]WGI67201.1 hypothetical protein QEO92_19620 [Neorhizobium petrolearium]
MDTLLISMAAGIVFATSAALGDKAKSPPPTAKGDAIILFPMWKPARIRTARRHSGIA